MQACDLNGRFGVDGAMLAAATFTAVVHPPGLCGSNGLPVTPNTIRILGRLTDLLAITHPALCQYIAVSRAPNGLFAGASAAC